MRTPTANPPPLRIWPTLSAFLFSTLALVLPTTGFAWHVDEEKLREEGIELEVEDLEVELDSGRVEVDYRIDSSDWRKTVRSGLSMWLGVFVERGEESSGQWDLWYAMPMLAEDGSAHFPEYLELRDRDHVVVRFIGISNGSYLSPGHGVFADGSLYVAVRGNHRDDHSHRETDDPHIERHKQLEHRSSVLYSVDVQLSYSGSLHRFGWFQPAYGFYRLRHWLEQQHLLTDHFRRHIDHHHHDRVITGPRRGVRHHHHHHHGRRR